MPELPEVEVLVRHLEPLLRGKRITGTIVRRPKVIAPTSVRNLSAKLRRARFTGLGRRGKYLLFGLRSPDRTPLTLVGHLGMTGRMYLAPAEARPPKHAAVILRLGAASLVFEDTRYFGRLTLSTGCLDALGPEPLGPLFTVDGFAQSLKRSRQPVKVKLLDQSLVAGVGNIYACEALFRAGIAPSLPARRLRREQVKRLWAAVRTVLREAIECGSTVPLNFSAGRRGDRLFYFGRAPEARGSYTERLRVYGREGEPCVKCACPVRRVVQAARSTFYCPRCQATRSSLRRTGKAKPRAD